MKEKTICTFKSRYHVVTTENEKIETNSSPTPKWTAPAQLPLDDDKFSDENKILVSGENVECVVCYENGYGMQANYKVT